MEQTITRKNKDNEYRIRFNEHSHTYHVSVNGTAEQKVRSVTSITKTFGADDKVNRITGWALKLAMEFLNEALKEKGSVSYTDFLLLSQEAKSAHRKELTRTADIGTAVHSLVEAKLIGEATLVEAAFEPFIRMFEDWWFTSPKEVVETEGLVYHPEIGYAGKFDCLVKENEKIYLVDFKTRDQVRKEDKLQLVAYIKAYEACTGVKIDGAKLVRLPRDTDKRPPEVEVVDLYSHWQAFLCCHFLDIWAREN